MYVGYWDGLANCDEYSRFEAARNGLPSDAVRLSESIRVQSMPLVVILSFPHWLVFNNRIM